MRYYATKNKIFYMTEVSEYIKVFPKEVQLILNEVRLAILQQAPNAIESMSYAMPAYKLLGKPLIYFACYKKHIGLYATPSGHKAFAKQLAKYKQGKGSVQFPFNETIPIALIKKIVDFKSAEIEKAAIKIKPAKS
jgi:uncharacterized protein YdhG (YjbR/CyaY superfamily)